jgi:hypothetical protein
LLLSQHLPLLPLTQLLPLMLLLPQPLTQLPLLLPTQPQHLLLMLPLQLHLLLTQLLLLQLKKRSSNLLFSDKRLFIQSFVTHKKASLMLAFLLSVTRPARG